MSGEGALLEEEIRNDSFIVFDHESEVQKLRGRWELASVLNFLSVFEPVLGNDFNLTAEEIEMGLIEANNSNTQLHIALLKGIPPVSKTLDRPDVWVTVLCKKLSEWWPWVAYGDIPLTAGNGEEVYKYRELDPTCRLLILKALCEIRVDQDDTVSYINDSLKQKTKLPSFRKEKLGEHANGTSYWYDGNAILGYRLYKEISKMNSLRKMRGKACSNLPVIYSHWETVATNLEEFQKVSTELLSSKAFLEIAIGKTVETDAIPVVKNFQKKKERALKRKKREEMLLSDLRNSSGAVRTTRSCRSRRPISYTFDEYDRAINEAIQLRKETSTEERQKWNFEHEDMATDLKDRSSNGGSSSDRETESDKFQEASGDDGDDDDYDGEKDEEYEHGDNIDNSMKENDGYVDSRSHETTLTLQQQKGSRYSKRLAGITSCCRNQEPGLKNRLRQRPTKNSAIDIVIPDSDNET